MFGILETGYGFWSPIIWIITIIVIGIILYIIWHLGEPAYKKGTEQTKPFLAGMPEPSKEAVTVRADNVYWGFKEALKHYYGPMIKTHSGIINDYISWFVVVLAIVFVIIGGLL
ncbi:MAG: hypothetical protein QMC80_05345 [Thermoplasmatales archaeon]|nr:hypothetical protein [Thermoplasmatales archaeon]